LTAQGHPTKTLDGVFCPEYGPPSPPGVATGRPPKHLSVKPTRFVGRLRFGSIRSWLRLCALLMAVASPVVGAVVGYRIGQHNSPGEDYFNATGLIATLLGFIAGVVIGAVVAGVAAMSGETE
jgi:CDP-diglyceride synthetase